MQHISVLTQHNNNSRSGWNEQENVLTTSTVNKSHFGKLFSLTTDDQVYAQPLVLSNILLEGKSVNLVIVATVNNTVYGYDGDQGTLFWKKNYTSVGQRPVRNTDMGSCGGPYLDFSGNIGIVGTPVINSAAQTLYFVARSTDGTTFSEYLHAVSLHDGSDLPGSPKLIMATVNGTGDANVNGLVSFDGLRQNQRQGLTEVAGKIYVGFSSHCDIAPYHGWVLGYDAVTLNQTSVYNDTPNGSDGGIWESGMGMAADPSGNLYLVAGNGTVGSATDPNDPTNRGESALKLTPRGQTLSVSSYFTPNNYAALEANDLDYGSMGALIIPGTHYFLTGGKDGNMYLLDKDNMGGLQVTGNQVQQTVFFRGDSFHCQPAFYQGPTGGFFYVWSENDYLRSIPYNNQTNLLLSGQQHLGTASRPTGQSGAVLSVSSNGSKSGSAILWASYALSGDANQAIRPGVLRAFDATDVTHELWNNTLNAGDYAGNYAKFSSPTIANGHVYLPTFSNAVVVYGLK